MAREAKRFVEFVHARSTAERSFISKLQAKATAKECGVEVAAEYALFQTVEDIHLNFALPFVLKATHLSTKRGVFLITDRQDNGLVYEELTRSWLSLDDIRNRSLADLKLEPPRANQFIVEEFIRGANEGPIPIDYQMYTFGGEVLFTLQVDRNHDPNAMCFFGKGMVPLTPNREIYLPGIAARLAEPNIPNNWPDMEQVAHRVATHMKANFIRVDVYTDGQRVILGELTTVPGGPYYGGTMFRFLPEFDRYLGEAWSRANRALGIPDPIINDDPPCFRKEAEVLAKLSAAGPASEPRPDRFPAIAWVGRLFGR